MRVLWCSVLLVLAAAGPLLAGPGFTNRSVYYRGQGPVLQVDSAVEWNRTGNGVARSVGIEVTNFKNGRSFAAEGTRSTTFVPVSRDVDRRFSRGQ
jgi:hypothetical protein